MYLNFENFRGQMSGGGGQALVGKWGRVPDGGGLTKFLPTGSTPPLPPPREKNPGSDPQHTITATPACSSHRGFALSETCIHVADQRNLDVYILHV